MRLFPTPVWLTIASRKSQLLQLGAIRQHAPDFFLPGPARLEHNVPPVRRPEGKVIAPTVVRELHPLLAGDIHQVNIRRARLSRPVFSNPGKRKELPVRSPVRRDRV